FILIFIFYLINFTSNDNILIYILFGGLYMKKKKVKKLILVFVITLMIITSNFYIYANDTNGANEILIQILNNAELSKINYLQGINIKENEYQEIQKFTLELVNNCKNDE